MDQAGKAGVAEQQLRAHPVHPVHDAGVAPAIISQIYRVQLPAV